MKELNVSIPRPQDAYEQQVYLATKISISGLYENKENDEATVKELETRFWNIYFWNVFTNRAKKVDCSKYIVNISRPRNMKTPVKK